tara:strand:+ start:651 stop:1154 length:504 start_codon:yes stop_codon:yes gene_type:complete
MNNELNLEVMDTDLMSLQDILDQNSTYAGSPVSKVSSISLSEQFTISKVELARYIQTGNFRDSATGIGMTRQARLIIKLAISTGKEVFTFADIDELTVDYTSHTDTSKVTNTEVWSKGNGSRYNQQPSVAGKTYIEWLLGNHDMLSSNPQSCLHIKNLGKFAIFVRV